MNNEAPVPYVFSNVGPRSPRCVIAYGQSQPVYRNIVKNRFGQPEIIIEARDVLTLRLDVSGRCEEGEGINEVSVAPCGCQADVNYSATSALVTIWNAAGDGSLTVEICLNTGETITERMSVRLPAKEFQTRVQGQPAFTRGSI